MSKVVNIPAPLPFLDTLAHGILLGGQSGGDPLGATRITVLLPTRRSCRALREAFLRCHGGTAALLPRIIPLGDLGDDEEGGFEGQGAEALDLPPPLPGITRQLLLTRLILARGDGMTPAQAARLAVDLARLLDEAHAEGVDLATLAGLVPASSELARHWQITVSFLEVLTTVWPSVLEAWGAVDPARHRDLALRLQAALWERRPPAGPLIAAGTTGSLPAAAALLKVVAALPQGRVVLPGLDPDLDDASWEALEDTHPQAGLKRLLADLGVSRHDVPLFEAAAVSTPPAAAQARARLVSVALRPAATSESWRHLAPGASGCESPLAQALEGVTVLQAPGQREEAMAVAVLLREALEVEGRTAALVTPDRTLARRVAAALDRWDIAVDDSGGRPLSNTPVGAFLRLSARACAESLAPVALLSLLQHPLAAGGEAPGIYRARVRRLDREVLRGPRPAPGIEGLRALIADAPPRLAASLARWLDRFEALAGPFLAVLARPAAPLSVLLEAHLAFAEGLAAARIDGVRQPGPLRLWAGEAGEAAAAALAALAEAAPVLDPLPPRHYPALFEALLDQTPVRPRFDRHPRLAIWGPLEARLQRPDLLILAGLNEGTWPAQVDTGPWMSRPMLQAFGLPQPERRIGLAAHDVSQALQAPEVVLSRSARVEGSPTVPSRWLVRLEAVARAAGLGEAWERAGQKGATRLAWARSLEHPPGPPARTPQPAPRPRVADRPRSLSVTRVETWMRDPYALYAEFVLGLRELDPLEADPGRADYGTLIHGVLEAFVRAWPQALPPDVEGALLRLGEESFRTVMTRPGVRTFWWPRFTRIAAWVARREREDRPTLAQACAEVRGRLVLDGPAGPFVLTAKADRLNQRHDGGVEVIDYKTGALPTRTEVEAGLAPQLPLEAALVQKGGFQGLPPASVAALTFWRLTGSGDGGEKRPAGKDPHTAAENALNGLRQLIALFDQPQTPYIARPHPDHAPRFNPYQHLARVREWAGAEDPE